MWASSQLELFTAKDNTTPSIFSWMTEPGLFFGQIECGFESSQDNVLSETRLLQYPPDEGVVTSASLLSPARQRVHILTQFHVLIAYPDRLRGVSTLNEQLIFEDVYSDAHGKVVGLTKDGGGSGTIWAFCERAVFKYKITRESRNVWAVYMEQGLYERAKQYCQDDPISLDKVITKQAHHLFTNQQYEESAAHYALTHTSFEEVTLKFLQAQQKPALRTYLNKKLLSCGVGERTQRTMLVMWILELYFNELGDLRDCGDTHTQHYTRTQQHMQTFITQANIKECVVDNKNSIYELLGSHGDQENLVFFTTLMKDYSRVIQHHIQHQRYTQALDVLQYESGEEHFYTFAPSLMSALPKQTVDLLIAQGRRLSPSRLIPALTHH